MHVSSYPKHTMQTNAFFKACFGFPPEFGFPSKFGFGFPSKFDFGFPSKFDFGLEFVGVIDKKLREIHFHSHKKRMTKVLLCIVYTGKHRQLLSRGERISMAICQIANQVGGVFCWQNWKIERAFTCLTYRQFRHYIKHGYALANELKQRQRFGW